MRRKIALVVALATIIALVVPGFAEAGSPNAGGYKPFENALFSSEVPADWKVTTLKSQYTVNTIEQPHDDGEPYCYFEVVDSPVPESTIQERYAGLVDSNVTARLYDAQIAGQPAKVLERVSLGGSAREIFAVTPSGEGYRMNFYCPDPAQALDFSEIQAVMDHFIDCIAFSGGEPVEGGPDISSNPDAEDPALSFGGAELEWLIDEEDEELGIDEDAEPQIWYQEGMTYEDLHAAASAGDSMIVVNCEEWVSLRAEPSKSSERLLQVPLGAVVTQCRDAENGFVACVFDGVDGYIHSDYLEPFVDDFDYEGIDDFDYEGIDAYWLGDYVGDWQVMDEDYCTVTISRAGDGYVLSGVFYRIASFDAVWLDEDDYGYDQCFRTEDGSIFCYMHPMADSFLLTVEPDDDVFGGYFDSRAFVCVR